MNDLKFKLKVLFVSLIDNFKAWKEQVWNVELDEYYCCNGRECGCMGTSQREYIKWQYQVDQESPKIVEFHKDF
jgi:hypothetical protein